MTQAARAALVPAFLAALLLIPAGQAGAQITDQNAFDTAVVSRTPAINLGNITFDVSSRTRSTGAYVPGLVQTYTFTTNAGAAAAMTGNFGGNFDSHGKTRWLWQSGDYSLTLTFNNDGLITVSGFGVKSLDNTSSSGWGGAIYARGALTFDGSGNYTFTNNQAIGGAATAGGASNSGQGGAIYANGALTFDGAGNYTFTNNKAIGGDASSNGSTSSSGQGGAIYAYNALTFNGSGNYTFTGNQAMGGDASNNSDASSSGWGGAICANGALTLNGAGNYTFTGNQAIGGAATAGGAAAVSGWGGAIFAQGDVDMTGGTFTGNSASTNTPGEMTSGLGGAIFIDAYGTNRMVNLAATAASGPGALSFSGNTHNPGGTGITPNSIYFGNTTSWGNDRVITATFDVAEGALFELLDPLASQEDDLQDLNYTYDNITLDLAKTGAGTMQLAGLSDMRSATNWKVSAGALHLVADANKNPAHIKLGHAATANFTLKSGASLLLEPTTAAHQISGQVINFESGSKVGLAGFRYGPAMSQGEHTVLTLNAANLDNQSSVPVTSGTIAIGAMNYKYTNLVWDPDRKNLIMTVKEEPEADQERSGGPAMTAPGAIRVYGQTLNIVTTRAGVAFGDLPDFRIAVQGGTGGQGNPGNSGLPGNPPNEDDEASLNGSAAPAPAAGEGAARGDLANSLWLTPYFAYTNQSGSGNVGYDLATPGLAFGYERQLCDRAFLGLGVSLSWPDYDAMGTDIEAMDTTFALYGGVLLPWALELDARIGYGFTSYDQTRRVENERYSSDYDGETFFVGAGLGRTFALGERFTLRPGARYDYIHLNTDGFDEGAGIFALKVDDYDQDLHRFKAGLEAGYTAPCGLLVSAEAYYLGLYGDRSARATAHFTAGPVNGFTTLGDALDENSLGLGARLSYPVNEAWEFGAGYNTIIGADAVSNEVELNVTFRF